MSLFLRKRRWNHSLVVKKGRARFIEIHRGIIGSLLRSCQGLCTFATFYEEEKVLFPKKALHLPKVWAFLQKVSNSCFSVEKVKAALSHDNGCMTGHFFSFLKAKFPLLVSPMCSNATFAIMWPWVEGWICPLIFFKAMFLWSQHRKKNTTTQSAESVESVEERQTLLNMIDMYKPAGAKVESFENPFYASRSDSIDPHPAMRFIVTVER